MERNVSGRLTKVKSDLILLDIVRPGMSVDEVVKQIKVKISTHWYRKYIRCPKERVLLIGKHCKIFPKTIRCILLSRKS